MEYVQLTPEISVPERTAELARRYSGVMRCLGMGLDVLHYLDRRDLDAAAKLNGELVVFTSTDAYATEDGSFDTPSWLNPDTGGNHAG